MRIRKILSGVLLFSILWAIAAPPALAQEEAPFVDFENGNLGFLSVYTTPIDACPASLSITELAGKKAAKLKTEGEGIPYLIIDVGSLLGSAVEQLREVQILIETQNSDGEFQAVSGEITAFSGLEQIGKTGAWSVYLEARNPNVAKLTLPEGVAFSNENASFLILNKKIDNAVELGQTPADLVLCEIRLLDEAGKLLPILSDAQLALPEGFGEADRSNLIAVINETGIGGAQGASPGGWGQAVVMAAVKNEGMLDTALIAPGTVITVYFVSKAVPEVILQSETAGAPPTAGWASVAAKAVNDSGNIAQFVYEDLVSAFGGDDFVQFLDKMFIGDRGEALEVSAVTIGMQE